MSEQVYAILFPPETKRADGSAFIDDADVNLELALDDLKDAGADRACLKTIERVLDKIKRVRIHRNLERSRDNVVYLNVF